MNIDVDLVARSCLGYRARMATLNLSRIYNAALRSIDLPITQFWLLVAIARNVARTQDAYAAVIGIERTTFLRNLRLLISRGWVEKPEDDETRLYRLTAEGEAVVARALPVWAAAQEKIVASIGGDHLTETYDSLRRLARLAPA